eukprot:56743-Chlamydomonas_euryale.AAC.4
MSACSMRSPPLFRSTRGISRHETGKEKHKRSARRHASNHTCMQPAQPTLSHWPPGPDSSLSFIQKSYSLPMNVSPKSMSKRAEGGSFTAFPTCTAVIHKQVAHNTAAAARLPCAGVLTPFVQKFML